MIKVQENPETRKRVVKEASAEMKDVQYTHVQLARDGGEDDEKLSI